MKKLNVKESQMKNGGKGDPQKQAELNRAGAHIPGSTPARTGVYYWTPLSLIGINLYK